MTSQLAAAPAVQGVSGGHILGAVTLSGLALTCAVLMILGIRKADRLKPLHNRDGMGFFAIVTGSVFIAAGGAWASTATGIGGVPTSVLGSGSGIGDPGQGAIALVLTALTFCPKWSRLIVPAFLGISAAVVYGTAGGVWGMVVNIIRMAISRITGGG